MHGNVHDRKHGGQKNMQIPTYFESLADKLLLTTPTLQHQFGVFPYVYTFVIFRLKIGSNEQPADIPSHAIILSSKISLLMQGIDI